MRAHLFAAALVASLAVSGTAGAETFPFEIAIAPQNHVATSDSLTGLTDREEHLAASVYGGYAVLDYLDVYTGYRRLENLRRFVDGADLTTELHAGLLGVRLRWPLKGDWLRLYGQVDLEADYARVEVSSGSGVGRQSVWSGGAVPEAGVEFSFVLEESVRLLGRLGVGYALRLDHDFDAVDFETAAAADRPLDLGAANFSGLHVGLTVGVRF